MSDNKVHFGDGLGDKAATVFNDKAGDSIELFITTLFDYIDTHIRELPEVLERIRNSPQYKQKIITQWIEHLVNEGVIPKSYNGLSINLMIHNAHQEGYLEGLYAGYILAMMALIDNGVAEETIIPIRDFIRSHLMRQYKDQDELINQFKAEKYNSIN